MADTSVTIIGNLTEDPELRFTPNGVPVAALTVAVTSRTKVGDSWEDGETSFFRVSVWREYAENVADSLHKGNRVVVVGTLTIEKWETPDGEPRSAAKITASEVTPSLRWATAEVTRTQPKRQAREEPAEESNGRRKRAPRNRQSKPAGSTAKDFVSDAPPF
jgi:single-strand DNA-binding protein